MLGTYIEVNVHISRQYVFPFSIKKNSKRFGAVVQELCTSKVEW